MIESLRSDWRALQLFGLALQTEILEAGLGFHQKRGGERVRERKQLFKLLIFYPSLFFCFCFSSKDLPILSFPINLTRFFFFRTLNNYCEEKVFDFLHKVNLFRARARLSFVLCPIFLDSFRSIPIKVFKFPDILIQCSVESSPAR